ncbi:MAG: SCP2 sterol-binding domain-containing protein [Gemmatimonadota bacterium]|nr:SCP2 sterol-binding domain-containing protein [Gemmatimonadota bacterium]
MTVPVFSDAWARSCGEALNLNSAYRSAAATWEGAILLRMLPAVPADGERLVFLDLWHGDCRAARAASPNDEAAARYVLAGTTAAWQQVLTGAVPPLLAIMTGKLKLTKGALAELLPYVNAAKELVLTAASVPGVFGGRE